MKIVNTALGLRRSLRAQVPDAQPLIQDSTAPQENLDNHSQLTKYPSRGERMGLYPYTRDTFVYSPPPKTPLLLQWLTISLTALSHCPGSQATDTGVTLSHPSSASLIQSTCELWRALQNTPAIHSSPSVVLPTHAGKPQLPNWEPGFHACLSPILLAPEPE